MKTNILLLSIVILLMTGCATIDRMANDNNQKMSQLSLGMTKQAVLSIMGTKRIRTGSVPAYISNPHKSDAYKDKDGDFIEVLYYFTGSKARDGAITEDETTPVVFVNNELVGWGHSFIDKIRRVEVRR